MGKKNASSNTSSGVKEENNILGKLAFVGLTALVVYLNYRDYKTTIDALENHDAKEANPIARKLYDRFGKNGLKGLKITSTTVPIIARSKSALLINSVITGSAVLNNELFLRNARKEQELASSTPTAS